MSDRTDWGLFIVCVMAAAALGLWLYRALFETPVAQPMCSDMVAHARERVIESRYGHLTDEEKGLLLPHVELRHVHARSADRDIGHVSCRADLYVRELVRGDSGEAVGVGPTHEFVTGVGFDIYTTDDGRLVSYTDA